MLSLAFMSKFLPSSPYSTFISNYHDNVRSHRTLTSAEPTNPLMSIPNLPTHTNPAVFDLQFHKLSSALALLVAAKRGQGGWTGVIAPWKQIFSNACPRETQFIIICRAKIISQVDFLAFQGLLPSNEIQQNGRNSCFLSSKPRRLGVPSVLFVLVHCKRGVLMLAVTQCVRLSSLGTAKICRCWDGFPRWCRFAWTKQTFILIKGERTHMLFSSSSSSCTKEDGFFRDGWGGEEHEFQFLFRCPVLACVRCHISGGVGMQKSWKMSRLCLVYFLYSSSLEIEDQDAFISAIRFYWRLFILISLPASRSRWHFCWDIA